MASPPQRSAQEPLIYENPLAAPGDHAGFVLEGQAALSVHEGTTRLASVVDEAARQAASYVWWCPQEVPADFEAEWDFWPGEHWPHNPLLAPDPGAGDRNMIRHTGLLPRGDRLLIFYSSVPDRDAPQGREEIRLATLDVSGEDWLRWGSLRRLGPVLTPEREWEAGDVRDPFPLAQGDTLYLYYAGGHERGIGLASVPLDALRGIAP